MSYRVFETDQKGANALAEDDLVSRQTMIVKDGKAWEIAGQVVVVEGSEDALDRAEALVTEAGGRVSPKAEAIKADLDAEGDAAAEGMGALFG